MPGAVLLVLRIASRISWAVSSGEGTALGVAVRASKEMFPASAVFVRSSLTKRSLFSLALGSSA